MNRPFLATFFLGVFLFSGNGVYACFYVVPKVREAVIKADAVFLGEVTEIIPPKRKKDP